MKSCFIALLIACCALGAYAEGDWRNTLDKVKNLAGDTGLAGFARKDAPDYITG